MDALKKQIKDLLPGIAVQVTRDVIKSVHGRLRGVVDQLEATPLLSGAIAKTALGRPIGQLDCWSGLEKRLQ